MASQAVLKLKVDDKEYSAGLKNAQQGLQALGQSLHNTGKSFSDVDKSVLDYVKSIGQMTPAAKSSRTAMREMSQTITDLTLTYRGLSEEERNSPFGMALADTLSELTERAGEIQDAMGDVAASIQHAASDTRAFDQVAGGVSFMTSAFQTAQGAAKMLGIELGDNVEVLARLQAAMAVTSGLQQLQNLLQKQSALMQGINALQARFNILARANPYVLLATGVAAVAGAFALWQKNGSAAKMAQEQLNREIANTQNQIQQIGAKVDFDVKIAEASGKSWEEIHRLRLEAARLQEDLAWSNLSKATAQNRDELIKQYKEASAKVDSIISEGVIRDIQRRNGTGPFARTKGIGGSSVSTVDKSEMQKVQEAINRLENEYTTASDERRRSIEKEIAALDKQAESLNRLKQMAHGTPFTAGELPGVTVTGSAPPLMAMQDALNGLNDRLALSKTTEEYQSILSDINAVRKEMAHFKGEETKVDKPEVRTSEALSTISSAVGSMVSGIEGLGIEIPKDIKNMLGALNSITMILTSIEAFQKVGTLLGIFSHGGVVKAASGYTVPGRRFSGDMIPAWLNAGETVLNQAQSGVIASALQDRDFSGGMGGQPYTNGENIILGINNTYKRKGMGEIVTTSMLRRMGLMN